MAEKSDNKQSFRGSQHAAIKEAFKGKTQLFITVRPGFYNTAVQLSGSPESKDSGVREVKIEVVQDQKEDFILHDDYQTMVDFIEETKTK